jgi:hypothetical protein
MTKNKPTAELVHHARNQIAVSASSAGQIGNQTESRNWREDARGKAAAGWRSWLGMTTKRRKRRR